MQNDEITLLVGGVAQSFWSSARIDSDLCIPADGWECDLGVSQGVFPSVEIGADVMVQIGGSTVLKGRIDDIDEVVEPGRMSMSLIGRDMCGVLADCSAPIFSKSNVTLEDVIADVVIPLGIHNVQVVGGTGGVFSRISVDPGESAWDVLERVARANGLWPWLQPDGTLIVGGSDYSTQPVASLRLTLDGRGNVLSLRRRRSMADRYSEVSVLGQARTSAISDGKPSVLAKEKDTSVSVYRPRVVIDADADTPLLARTRARWILSQGRVRGLGIDATVDGFRIGEDGELWSPGQRVHIYSEPHKIDGIYLLMGRTFERSLSGGDTTYLRLVEDGVWTIDAEPDSSLVKRDLAIFDFKDSTDD